MVTRVLIADDHPIVRTGIVHLLSNYNDQYIMSCVSDGEQALQALATAHHELAIVDISMPKIDGLLLVKIISEMYPNTTSIVLTLHDDQVYIDKAFEYGAKGYLLKEDADENIIECINRVRGGFRYLSRTLITLSSDGAAQSIDIEAPLTRSELKIIELVAAYKTSREISTALSVTVRTVQNHRANIVRKLNLSGSNALLKYAIGYQHLNH